MKFLWIEEQIDYDGSQLRSLFAYLNFKVLGNSIVAFRGGCEVDASHMVDGEDLLDGASICGSDMLHFIIEVFDQKLITGVFIQRLFAGIVQNRILDKSNGTIRLNRKGDDLYYGNKKLSISIASQSPQSVLVHFGINISNEGTPVETCSLSDFAIQPAEFAKELIYEFSEEFKDIEVATWKVKPVP